MEYSTNLRVDLQFKIYAVQATENGGEYRAECTVVVLILDVDDNPPMWIFPAEIGAKDNETKIKPPSEVVVSSMTPIGHTVATARVSEPDSSSVLQFSIERSVVDIYYEHLVGW